jgi:hypothetical protein
MNAPEQPQHFMYFPGDYRWSAEMLVVIGTAQYGGADFTEADRIARTLRDRVGDDEASFRASCEAAELLRGRAQAASRSRAEGGIELSALVLLKRAGNA